jgi:hypothetical protein
MKSREPHVLQMARLIDELACAVPEFVERFDNTRHSSVFVHSTGCLGSCDYACGGVALIRNESGEIIEVET